MTTRELIIRARNIVEASRASSKDGLLSDEMFIMELMAHSLDYHLLMNLRMETAIHEQIKCLDGIIKKTV